MRILAITVVLTTLLSLQTAQAAPPLTEAMGEMRSELASARKQLREGDLELGNRVTIGSKRAAPARDDSLPKAVITPEGQLRIDGHTVTTTPAQRTLLLDYRRQMIDVAEAGIDVGERAATVVLQSMDTSLLSLLASAMTGRLEKKVEQSVRQELLPLASEVCDRLPPVLAAQNRLAAHLPEFRPYANLQDSDVRDCRKELAQSLATL